MIRSVRAFVPVLTASATRIVPTLSSLNVWSGGMMQVTLLLNPVRNCAPSPSSMPTLAGTHFFPSVLAATAPVTSTMTTLSDCDPSAAGAAEPAGAPAAGPDVAGAAAGCVFCNAIAGGAAPQSVAATAAAAQATRLQTTRRT